MSEDAQTEKERVCTRCQESKAISAYNSRGDGRKLWWCKSCVGEYSKGYEKTPRGAERKKAAQDNWHRRNPDYYIVRKYGLKPGQYDEMFRNQAGGCAICGTPPRSGRRLDVDHCHGSGTVRGLLCTDCNLTLGKMQDSPERLRAAAAYVEQFQDNTTA